MIIAKYFLKFSNISEQFPDISVCTVSSNDATVYMVYLAVALIWRFGESRLYRQIKCTPFRL